MAFTICPSCHAFVLHGVYRFQRNSWSRSPTPTYRRIVQRPKPANRHLGLRRRALSEADRCGPCRTPTARRRTKVRYWGRIPTVTWPRLTATARQTCPIISRWWTMPRMTSPTNHSRRPVVQVCALSCLKFYTIRLCFIPNTNWRRSAGATQGVGVVPLLTVICITLNEASFRLP